MAGTARGIGGTPGSPPEHGSGGPESIPLTATPDRGTRLSPRSPWQESTRPTHQEPEDATYGAAQQATAQHLVDVHDGLRGELQQLRAALQQVREGQLTIGAARSVVSTMTLRQNNWTLGSYCESYCRIVTGHHTLEDRGIFTHLRRSEPGLGPVLDRLVEEHEVIHGLLEEFDRALVRLVTEDVVGAAGREVLDDLQDTVDLLTDALLSHFSYEERELLGPIARVGML